MATKLWTSSRLITTNLCMVGNPLTSIKNSFEHPFRTVCCECMHVFVGMCVFACLCCVCMFVWWEGGGREAGKKTLLAIIIVVSNYILCLQIPSEMRKIEATQVSASPCPYHGTASCCNS